MGGMKLSVSLSDADVAFLDEVAKRTGSRSAALQEAVRLMREMEMVDDYIETFAEWDASPDKALWDSTSGDGIE